LPLKVHHPVRRRRRKSLVLNPKLKRKLLLFSLRKK
jgi:hypothetical protein